MQDKLLGTLYEYFVHFFHVQLGPQGNSRKGLRFTPGEYGRAVGHGQVINFAPNGTDFSRLAAVQADAVVQNHVAHGAFFHIVVITGNHKGFFLALFFREGLQKLFLKGFKSV